MNTQGATMATTTGSRDERHAAVAVEQLRRFFAAVGVEHCYAVVDADKWEELLVWAGDARRYVVKHGRVAADVIELKFGDIEIHVQGPTREPTLDDVRRILMQREAEEG